MLSRLLDDICFLSWVMSFVPHLLLHEQGLDHGSTICGRWWFVVLRKVHISEVPCSLTGGVRMSGSGHTSRCIGPAWLSPIDTGG